MDTLIATKSWNFPGGALKVALRITSNQYMLKTNLQIADGLLSDFLPIRKLIKQVLDQHTKLWGVHHSKVNSSCQLNKPEQLRFNLYRLYTKNLDDLQRVT